MIELVIAKTCMFATTGRNAGWQRYDNAREAFPDMPAAREWLRKEYGTAKRLPMYRDRKDGRPQRIGYVISFRPRFRSKSEPVSERHWVEFRECTPVDLGAA